MQSSVGLYLAPGVPGAKATPDQCVYTPENPIAAVDLPVGQFVFAVGNDPHKCTNVGTTASSVLGFAERVINYVLPEYDTAGSLTIPKGSAVTVAVRGDYWVKTADAAAVGDGVFALKADGSIKVAATPPDNSVDTGWKVKKGGAVGDMIIISNWNVAPGGLAQATQGGGDSNS